MVDGIRLLTTMVYWLLLYCTWVWRICWQVWICAFWVSSNHHFAIFDSRLLNACNWKALWQAWLQDVRIDIWRFLNFKLSFNPIAIAWLPRMLVEFFPSNLKWGYSSHLHGSYVGIHFFRSARITGWDGFWNHNLLLKSRDHYTSFDPWIRPWHHYPLSWILLGRNNSLCSFPDKRFYKNTTF